MPSRNMPDKKIVDYWEVHEDECGLGVDWAEAHERCWRCGYESVLHQCHIIPESRGGPYEPSNLVLLCERCHREAPNVADPRFMWVWLRATCVGFYDTYWTERGCREFEVMFGRKPFTGPEFEGIDQEQALAILKEELKKVAHHFGEPNMNPATIASVFALVEERLTGKPICIWPDRSHTQSYFESMGLAKPRQKPPADEGAA